MTDPTVTILMSVYNGEPWLDESISSVLAQTFRDFEFLIVNDGSSDGSLEIIRRYSDRDPRIKIIDKQNSGLADSLNQGIAQARGQWIARIDADDLCEEERLEQQYVLAQLNPDLVLLGTGLQQIDEEGHPGKIFRYPQNHHQLVKRLNSLKPFFAHSSAFYRTDVVRSLGGYRLRFKRAQDWDLWLRLSEIGDLSCVDLPLVRIRQHECQISYKDGGVDQRVDGYVAAVSYWLRQAGFDDPADDQNSEKSFVEFRSWIIDCLKRERVFEYSLFVKGVKKNMAESQSLFAKLSKLLFSFLRKPLFFFRYLQNRTIGERLPKTLARDWARCN